MLFVIDAFLFANASFKGLEENLKGDLYSLFRKTYFGTKILKMQPLWYANPG